MTGHRLTVSLSRADRYVSLSPPRPAAARSLYSDTTDSAADDPNGDARQRRARKSVNYREPSLHT